jgi:glycosyltransferase involved in cell wall biosynthesis
LTADTTIFVSRTLKQAILGRRSAKSAHVVYNGVASEAVFDERRRKAEVLRGRRQPFTFVLVGRFRESKGQHIAIEAFARIARGHEDVRLLLVGGAGQTGDQNYLTMCQERVQSLQLSDRIEFWGYISDVERAYLAADAALMCSRNEAMGRVTVEAMSACRPVIGFDSGGTPELIEKERSGLLYSGGPESLAEKMDIYVRAPDLAHTHGETAWHVARTRFSIEAYAAQIAERLREICKKES